MNTDELIEHIHDANLQRRMNEHSKTHRTIWRIAMPAAAVAAIMLIVLLPRGNKVQAAPIESGIYCNSQCNPDDVLALIDNNINHIKTIQSL